jgi:hypothetical protein
MNSSKSPNNWVKSSMANTRIKAWTGQGMVDGKSFRLAYIQRRSAAPISGISGKKFERHSMPLWIAVFRFARVDRVADGAYLRRANPPPRYRRTCATLAVAILGICKEKSIGK